ncbi:LytR cell envelope-related transcriptional attenuator [Williamsia limnetica]|uniref:LytR cell envelope-related transcriptional attenuator n=1 Tax=Williamsia limnetica TaxID=882452 RepID=A0A318RJR4_WILLI|nr:LytR C-terminal domain-containing protein [Williamsia limnetica]PYE16787.1 LytR cell envelope-related transcriptional attenuator [Williamsia limnetica]
MTKSEPPHLPFRAGAMLLLAIAVVFIGLGWHSAATGDSDPEAGLEAAQSRQPTSSSTEVSAPSRTSTSASSSASVDPDRPQVCVFNAGAIGGLGQTYARQVEGLGWDTAAPTNLQSASITENTVFYSSGQREAAEQLADDLGGEVSVDPRPAAFDQCPRGLPLIVVTR